MPTGGVMVLWLGAPWVKGSCWSYDGAAGHWMRIFKCLDSYMGQVYTRISRLNHNSQFLHNLIASILLLLNSVTKLIISSTDLEIQELCVSNHNG